MRAVVFDLFETLITEWGREKYTTLKAAADLGVDAASFRSEWETLHDDMYLGVVDAGQAYRIILDRLGCVREPALLACITQKREANKAACFANVEPMITDMLRTLKDAGYRIGLVSNCSSDEVAGLRECELAHYMDAVVLSCEARVTKPDARIYRYCLERLGVRPEDAWFVGDGGSDELNGAARAGLRPVKALWFIKRFVEDNNSGTTFPACAEPSALLEYVLGGNHSDD